MKPVLERQIHPQGSVELMPLQHFFKETRNADGRAILLFSWELLDFKVLLKISNIFMTRRTEMFLAFSPLPKLYSNTFKPFLPDAVLMEERVWKLTNLLIIRMSEIKIFKHTHTHPPHLTQS